MCAKINFVIKLFSQNKCERKQCNWIVKFVSLISLFLQTIHDSVYRLCIFWRHVGAPLDTTLLTKKKKVPLKVQTHSLLMINAARCIM